MLKKVLKPDSQFNINIYKKYGIENSFFTVFY